MRIATTDWKVTDQGGNEVQIAPQVREKVLRDDRIFCGQIIRAVEVCLPSFGWFSFTKDGGAPVKVLESGWKEFDYSYLHTIWHVKLCLPSDRLIELKNKEGVIEAIELSYSDPREVCYVNGFSYELSPSLDKIVDYCANWKC